MLGDNNISNQPSDKQCMYSGQGQGDMAADVCSSSWPPANQLSTIKETRKYRPKEITVGPFYR